jgi:hypothetical protein
MSTTKDKSWQEPKGKENKAFDKSWTAPETTAFKNITPDDIPDSTYNYKGETVSKSSNLPNSDYNYKGEAVGKSNNLPTSNYNYKGTKVGKASK